MKEIIFNENFFNLYISEIVFYILLKKIILFESIIDPYIFFICS